MRKGRAPAFFGRLLPVAGRPAQRPTATIFRRRAHPARVCGRGAPIAAFASRNKIAASCRLALKYKNLMIPSVLGT